MRLPNREDGPVAFTITDGANWNAFARSNLTLNAASGDLIQWQPYEASSAGQKLRGWLRFAHTGELGGLAGQVVAGLGCLGDELHDLRRLEPAVRNRADRILVLGDRSQCPRPRLAVKVAVVAARNSRRESSVVMTARFWHGIRNADAALRRTIRPSRTIRTFVSPVSPRMRA